jgi:hypothetical protein
VAELALASGETDFEETFVKLAFGSTDASAFTGSSV